MTEVEREPGRQFVQEIEDRLFRLAEKAGFSPVLLNALQPADLFIDLSGENLRQRLCLIEHEGGGRQCLRPDFTIPTGLSYVASLQGGPPIAQKISYAGPVYRRQPDGTPQEISQVGLESFGDVDRISADVEILSFILGALSRIGITKPKLVMGDLGLFAALLEAIDMPARWRTALCGAVWRPAKFDRLLSRFSQNSQPENGDEGLLASVDNLSRKAAQNVVAKLIKDQDGMIGDVLPGGRTLADITDRVMARALDAGAYPLPQERADQVRHYLQLKGEPGQVLSDITALSRDAELPMDAAIEQCSSRLELLEKRGVKLDNVLFSTEFGRTLEYYTGFVFEVSDREGNILAGGGRYDTLLAQLGLDAPAPAVGCAFKVANVAAQAGRAG